MFTGIISEMGKIDSLVKNNKTLEVKIFAPQTVKNLNVDESVSVNGICLTAKEVAGDFFIAQIIVETIDITNVSFWGEDHLVNLENAMTMADAFDGHMVQGHVDGLGEIIKTEPQEDDSNVLGISLPKGLMQFVAYKGSIAIEGVSLTVSKVDLEDSYVEVSLIPHTLEVTTLGFKNLKDQVNIEVDIMAKYVANYVDQYLNIKG